MLVVDRDSRASAENLEAKMENLDKECRRTESYCVISYRCAECSSPKPKPKLMERGFGKEIPMKGSEPLWAKRVPKVP
jgi:hypothetical protein